MFTLILITFIISSLIQFYFWLGQLYVLRKARVTISQSIATLPNVSVVVAVKNEIDLLQDFVDRILDQEYHDFHLILIDDHSTDFALEELTVRKGHSVTILSLPGHLTGKKAALSYGIQHANTEWILLTDVDCQPLSNLWISSMMQHTKNSDVILGYSPTKKVKGFLSGWIHYETWYIAIQYLSATYLKRPYMAVGRNMAFRKQVFEQVKGYSSHADMPSGNDDLFIHSLPAQARVEYCISEKSWMETTPPSNFHKYILQKRRHLTTAPRYPTTTKIWLIVVFISQLLWFLTIFYLPSNAMVLIALALRYLILIVVARAIRSVLSMRSNLLIVPVIDFLLMIFYLILSPTFIISKRDW